MGLGFKFELLGFGPRIVYEQGLVRKSLGCHSQAKASRCEVVQMYSACAHHHHYDLTARRRPASDLDRLPKSSRGSICIHMYKAKMQLAEEPIRKCKRFKQLWNNRSVHVYISNHLKMYVTLSQQHSQPVKSEFRCSGGGSTCVSLQAGLSDSGCNIEAGIVTNRIRQGTSR